MVLPYLIAAHVIQLMLAEQKSDHVPLKVIDFATGGDSKTSQPQITLARDLNSWANVWAIHRTDEHLIGAAGVRAADETTDLPKVNFDTHMVLVIFGGTCTNVAGYTLEDAGTKNHHSFVYIKPVVTRSGTITQQTFPYAFIELTRVTSDLEVYVAKVDGADLVWEKIKTFPKPKG